MRRGQIAAGMAILPAVGLAGGLVVFLNPSQDPLPRAWPSGDALFVDERSRYYRQDDGSLRLVLPGACGGYRLFDAERLQSEPYSVTGTGGQLETGNASGSLTFTADGYVAQRSDGSQVRAQRPGQCMVCSAG